MSRPVTLGLSQAITPAGIDDPLQLRQAMIDLHGDFVRAGAERGVNVLCFQELCTGPYFCAEQDVRWYAIAESAETGPTVTAMTALAKSHGMVLVVPIYEEDQPGVYYNTAVVIDADGSLLGKYRKNHIPHCHPGFWEKFYFRPGNLGYPVFETAFGRVGVYICYDRHFPEGARELGLGGAEMVFIPSATTKGHSRYLWELEQRAHAVANGYFVATNNRVGMEAEQLGPFFGASYVCDPRGAILAQGSETEAELVTATVDLDLIREVRDYWQFYRDRRPDSYEASGRP